MSYYRNTYLKSKEWKSLRKEKIFKDGFRCKICHIRPKKKNASFGSGLDVHHLKYKKLHDVDVSDLRTLCRTCHKSVHDLMVKYPKLKTLDRSKMWHTILYHLDPSRRNHLAGMIEGIRPDKSSNRKFVFDKFCEHKRSLISEGKICRNRMRWREEFSTNPKIEESLCSQEHLVLAYLEVTKQDPRRLMPVLLIRSATHFAGSRIGGSK